MRSKSVENFFQRSQSDAYLPKELLAGVLPSSPRLFTGPAPGNSSAVLPSPSISSRPAPFCVQPRPAQTHSFLEHVFRRPTSCSLCKLIIAGKQGMKLFLFLHFCPLFSNYCQTWHFLSPFLCLLFKILIYIVYCSFLFI